MKQKTYLRLQIKRAFKLYPAILLITLITVLSMVLTCSLLLQHNLSSDDKKKISIGLVGDTQDTFLEIGVYALQNFDNSRFSVNILKMEEEDAIRALKGREIHGYARIPENYIHSILNGQNIPAEYITLNSPDGFGSTLSSEIATIVSDLVTDVQQGVYAMQNVATEHQKTANMWDHITNLNLAYVDSVLNRSDLYHITTLGIADKVSLVEYYICGLLLFFMLIWGISVSRLLGSRKMSLSRSLNARGMHPAHQMLCEYAAYLLITLLTLQIFALLTGSVLGFNDFGIRELTGMNITTCMGFMMKILPVIMMITMMQMALYELVPNTVGAVLLQFIIAIGLGYISGCFYPNTFFPEAVQNFAAWLPTGVGFAYMRQVISETLALQSVGMTLIYLALFALLALGLRIRRIAGDQP